MSINKKLPTYAKCRASYSIQQMKSLVKAWQAFEIPLKYFQKNNMYKVYLLCNLN